MTTAVFTAVAFTTALLGLPCVQSQGVSRMAMYEYYDQFQDIAKAFNSSKFYWFYASNYDTLNIEDRRCINVRISELTNDGMVFETGYMQGNTSKETSYYGNFYVSWPVIKNNKNVQRNISNALHVVTEPGQAEVPPTNFSLVYSDYKDCIILLVLNEDIKSHEFAPEYMETYATQCIVLLSDSEARRGINNTYHHKNICQNQYYNACLKYKGQENSHRQYYDGSCGSPENDVTPTS
uniref:Putative lipocalin-2 1 n=1 Tax=Amblyomma cajennense TaxID=34607 RepID=A0A023FUG2_AMBCJ